MPPDLLDDAVDVLEELPREAALADARLAGDGDEAHPALARGRVEQVLEQPQLRVTPHERGFETVVAAAAASLGHDPHRAPGRDGQGLPLEIVLAGRLVGHRAGGREVRRLADEDGPGRGGGLEPRSGVHEVACHHALVRGAQRHGRLAREHAAARLDARADPPDGVDKVERCPDSTLRVILVGRGGSPEGHDGIADELLHPAAVPPDDLRGQVEVRREELPHGLGIPPFGQRGEADEIREQHGDETTFCDRGRLGACATDATAPADARVGAATAAGDRAAAVAAEADRGRVDGTAGRTGQRETRATLAAELAARLVDGRAAGAGHGFETVIDARLSDPSVVHAMRITPRPGRSGHRGRPAAGQRRLRPPPGPDP